MKMLLGVLIALKSLLTVTEIDENALPYVLILSLEFITWSLIHEFRKRSNINTLRRMVWTIYHLSRLEGKKEWLCVRKRNTGSALRLTHSGARLATPRSS